MIGENEEYSKGDNSKFRNKVSHNHGNDVTVNEIYIPKPLQKDTKEALKYIPSTKNRKAGNCLSFS